MIWLIGRLNAGWADLVDWTIVRWVGDWTIWSSDLQRRRTKKKEKIKREEEEREQEECKEEGKNKTVKLESLKLKFHVDSHHLQIET